MIVTDPKRQVIVLLLAAMAGFMAGFLWGPPGSYPAVVDQQRKAELFGAVDEYLKAHGISGVDLPKQILEVQEIGERRYLVHMELGLGNAWFEVWEEDGGWQVRGVP